MEECAQPASSLASTPSCSQAKHDGLVTALQRVIGAGWLSIVASSRLARETCSAIRAQLDEESLWRELFLRRFRDVQLPVDSLAPSWRRLAARELPSGGFVVNNPASRPDRVPKWEASVLVMGPPCSGKTWLVHRMCNGCVPGRLDSAPFLGSDMRAAVVRLHDGNGGEICCRVRVWEPFGLSRQQVLGGYLRSSAVVVVVVNAAESQAPKQASVQLELVKAGMRQHTVVVLCGAQSDRLDTLEASRTARELHATALAEGVEFGLCSAVSGDGVERLFCSVLAAAREAGRLSAKQMPTLNHDAGTMSNSELLRALLHRR